ncbi:MAG: prepilin-type N-terminal cleavage/methylation domain-containing protein, partial [Victivallales bacterium]|nr:prepilin-type N-terminal cleavage/methylation domain-containing protein [Victivallales bacterium]
MKRNFTLVELLVVTVIIGIIVGATVPAFTRLMTGNAVSYGLRMTTSQLNMARVEACARRKYVAVVFLDKDSNDPDAYLPSTGDNVGYRCAFRSCYVRKSINVVTLKDDYIFEEWIQGTKWEYLPKGAYFSNDLATNNLLTVKDVFDEDGLFKDTNYHDVLAVIFSPTGKPADKTNTFEIVVSEGVVTDNATVITRPDTDDNKLT